MTSAAVVMVAVFAIFATLSTLDMKQMGVGLAVAVLLDATIIRGVLLPATMKLLGRWNWYLPRGLRLAAAARGRVGLMLLSSLLGRRSRDRRCAPRRSAAASSRTARRSTAASACC